MPPHRVIGLISGGKDSTFNLLHCVANGHELVALATLTPEPGIDELDSHMYQSVGTTLVPMLAQAMGLPHYSRTIKGKAIAQGAEYGDRQSLRGVDGDETEDLYELLKMVLRDHDATAIASGAILSNYQRLRVEHVSNRLRLVSLSYLWQQPQLPLIEKMVDVGMDVILVKVAGIGLGVDCVGKSLKEMLPLLRKLSRQYGLHPAGEGGEYETLTLSTPMFSKRLQVTDFEVIVSDPEPSLVAYFKILASELIPMPDWQPATRESLAELLGDPELYDEQSRDLLDSLEPLPADSVSGYRPHRPQHHGRNASKGPWKSFTVAGGAGSVDQQVHHCFKQLNAEHIKAIHITLLISDMNLFALANTAYSTYFGTSPPSRATVAVPLPPGQHVAMHMLAHVERPQTLHVQSLSYWAPANIGPYSQASSVDGRVIIAGQVPLVPATLEVIEPFYRLQSVLALQHARRIIDVLRSPNTTGGGWQGIVESCVVWWVASESALDGWRTVLQAWQLWSAENNADGAPVLFVQASALPKSSLVEFQVNVNKLQDSHIPQSGESGAVWWEAACCTDGILRGVVFGQGSEGLDAVKALLQSAISAKLFYTPDANDLASVITWLDRLGFIVIPVHSINDRNGRPATWAIETLNYAREG